MIFLTSIFLIVLSLYCITFIERQLADKLCRKELNLTPSCPASLCCALDLEIARGGSKLKTLKSDLKKEFNLNQYIRLEQHEPYCFKSSNVSYVFE